MSMIPYDGSEPYIFISYSHKDSDRVFPIIDHLHNNAYRVWYDEGINPGSECDDSIAKHIVNCEYFIAFISENYLSSKYCKDELKYARDEDMHILLVYLDDITLPEGLAMRLNGLQYIRQYTFQSEKSFYQKLFSSQGLEKAQIYSYSETNSGNPTRECSEIDIEIENSQNAYKLYRFLNYSFCFSLILLAIVCFWSPDTVRTHPIIFTLVYSVCLFLCMFSFLKCTQKDFIVNKLKCYRFILSHNVFSLNAISIETEISLPQLHKHTQALLIEERWDAAYVDKFRNELIILRPSVISLPQTLKHSTFKLFQIYFLVVTACSPLLIIPIHNLFAFYHQPLLSSFLLRILLPLLRVLLFSFVYFLVFYPIPIAIVKKRIVQRDIFIIIQAEHSLLLQDIATKTDMSIPQVMRVVNNMIHKGVLQNVYLNQQTKELIWIESNDKQ